MLFTATNNKQQTTTNHQPQQQYPNPLLSISMDSESQPDNSWKLLGYGRTIFWGVDDDDDDHHHHRRHHHHHHQPKT